ncbi:isopenicillin N synthase family dioxygenase [Derxia gummosa]|uniref:2-oxoglutarate-dependent ethylene/succinate-forming enzyme n=1 Tax=Derxia gummosa DSM 723 TaxID=1121388 RepID=A0A8B6X6P7_9BURK|nr:2-oxoglutarate and iron-dependent oxygenase domain-containing protein [Derxia gummosa]
MVQYVPPVRALAPVLDIARWRDGSDKPGVAREFDRICREIGFFYLTGHGMAPARMAGILREAERFFVLPLEAKQALHVAANRRGYEPMGLQSLDFDAPPDLKESMLIGRGNPPDHPYVLAGLANYGANQWPDEAALPGFRAFCEGYFAEAAEISRMLMAIFATVAGLPEDHFEPMLREPMATLRMIHYPPQPGAVVGNRIGCGAHTDWGAITLLVQDDTGGLEVQAASGEWLYAEPLPGAFVVNVGDMMPVWTDGAYHSNPHRVRNRSPERHRYSVPFFMDLDYFARVERLPAFAAPGSEARHAPRTAGEHLDLMYRLSYGEG